jgi:hypothetical protein
MLNSFDKKQNGLNDKLSIASYVIEKNTKIKSNSEINEYENTFYYPSPSKE